MSEPAGAAAKAVEVKKQEPCCTRELMNRIMLISDIIAALIVIGLGEAKKKYFIIIGIYKYVAGSIENFSEVFVPFYLISFGVLLICAEMEWLFIVKYFKFLDNYFGRLAYFNKKKNQSHLQRVPCKCRCERSANLIQRPR